MKFPAFRVGKGQPAGWISSCMALMVTWCVGLIAGHALHGAVRQWLVAAPVELGRWLRTLSLAGGGGNMAAWAVTLAISALPLLGLLWRGRRWADLLLPLTGAILFAWIFYLVNPTLLDTFLPVTEGWGMVGIGAAGSLLVAWAVLRLLQKLDGDGRIRLPEVLYAGAVIYVLFLGMGTVQQIAAEVAALKAANTGNEDIAAFTANTVELLTVWKSMPSLMTAVLVMWGGDLLRALETDPFAEETVALAEQISRRCDWVVYLTLFVTVHCNLAQMFRFSRLASVDVTVYFPVMTLALAAVLRTLCRYFRRAKAVSDDNDTII